MLKSLVLAALVALATAAAAQGCHRKNSEQEPQNSRYDAAPLPENQPAFTQRHLAVAEKIQGDRSGYDTAQNLVVKDKGAFEAVWRKIHASVFPTPEPIGVDFEKEMIIVVFMGQCPTGGYSINIIDVVENADKLEVQVTRKRPASGDTVPMVVTQPFCLVRMERVDKEAVFLDVSTGEP